MQSAFVAAVVADGNEECCGACRCGQPGSFACRVSNSSAARAPPPSLPRTQREDLDLLSPVLTEWGETLSAAKDAQQPSMPSVLDTVSWPPARQQLVGAGAA